MSEKKFLGFRTVAYARWISIDAAQVVAVEACSSTGRAVIHMSGGQEFEVRCNTDDVIRRIGNVLAEDAPLSIADIRRALPAYSPAVVLHEIIGILAPEGGPAIKDAAVSLKADIDRLVNVD